MQEEWRIRDLPFCNSCWNKAFTQSEAILLVDDELMHVSLIGKQYDNTCKHDVTTHVSMMSGQSDNMFNMKAYWVTSETPHGSLKSREWDHTCKHDGWTSKVKPCGQLKPHVWVWWVDCETVHVCIMSEPWDRTVWLGTCYKNGLRTSESTNSSYLYLKGHT